MRIQASYHQERLWFVDKFEAGTLYESNPVYHNIPLILDIYGVLAAGVLERSIQGIINRHEALRTGIITEEDKPIQLIAPEVDFKLKVIDWVKDVEDGKYERALELSIEISREPFSLDKDSLIRGALIKLTDTHSILVITIHHIIADKFSLGILAREIAIYYEGYRNSHSPRLQDLSLQYADFSQWQRSLPAETVEFLFSYWRRKLRGKLQALELPTDSPRAVIHRFTEGRETFRLSAAAVSKVKAVSKEVGVSEFVVLLAAFKILLHIYSGLDEVVVGTSVDNRRQPGTGEIVGPLANLIVVRSFLNDRYTFRKVAAHLDRTVSDAFKHQDLPFDKLVLELNPEKDMSRTALFDVLFQYEEKPLRPISVDSLEIKPVETNLGWGKYDLNVLIQQEGEFFSGFLTYNRDYYHRSTISRLIGHYKVLLESIFHHPGDEISRLSFLTGEDRRQLLVEWNQTEVGYPKDRSIQRIFEEQAEKTPGKVAVICGNESLTYGRLNQRANRLAWYLKKNYSLGRDSIAALLLERSPDMIIGILGILKAGGAYLPIDPEYPLNRIVSILEDSNAAILLTDSEVVKDKSFTALQGLRTASLQPHMTPGRQSIRDLDRLPLPNRSLVDYEKYNRYIGHAMVKNSVSLQGTRGCPYNCAYCHKIWPKKQTSRSAEHIFEEVKLYYNMGVRRFAFIDDIFNLDIKNTSRFYQLIIKNKLDVNFFFPAGLRGDIMTPDYIDLMIEAGVISFALALETASPRLQKFIGKHLNIERLAENIEYICKKHPQVILELFTMHGFPTETEEEALKTLNFIKSKKWIHFPYVNILNIYPNTDMERLALEHGVTKEAIIRSTNLTHHELSDTLPFEKSFTLKYQADFWNNYFLSKERLLHVLPQQMKALTEDEIIQKYTSYMPVEAGNFDELISFFGIQREEIGEKCCLEETRTFAPGLNEKMRRHFFTPKAEAGALRVLLLDLSQSFVSKGHQLNNLVEPPLGLMYLVTNLHREFGGKIKSKIAKSRIDFENYEELKKLLEEFRPDIIGTRTLVFFKDFFHEAIRMIRQWGFAGPIIAGGPYATTSTNTILNDGNIDLIVLGEGEVTFNELIGKIIACNGKLPGEDVLEQIPGISFIPEREKERGQFGREIILLDGMKEKLSAEPDQNPENINQPADLAYVIYTSGSTGKPKGSLIDHNNVIRLMFNDKFLFDFTESDVWTMFHTYCFDFSVWEMYGALLRGAKLIIVSKKISQTPTAFLKLLEDEHVTILNQVPAAFYKLSEEVLRSEKKRNISLRYIIFGGEALNPVLLADWLQRYPETRLINMYGITETTVHVTFKEIGNAEIEAGRSNIGRPIPTLRCYIVDRYLRLVPPGVSGEIVVGGEGVCRGYLNRGRLTREKFIENPFIKGDRLYRSGDLGRWQSDGNIEYLGRIDNQVKIRGYRIECGEIENHILAYEKVKEVVVMAKSAGDKEDNKFLVAYLAADKELSGSDLRVFLKGALPDYMIPAYFIQLKKFPLTSSGKIDKKLLPAPEIGQSERTVYEPPKTRTQTMLVKIWQEVLKVENIGILDDFFSLGGDSIKGIRVINKIQEWFQEIIHVSVLFESPTIKELAEVFKSHDQGSLSRIDEAKFAEFKEIIPTLPPFTVTEPKLPPAVFVLCPPRSGSTLLRIILQGHPQLTAPPELGLLSFNTLGERKRAYSGRRSFLLEGFIRAIMGIKTCSAEESRAIVEVFEEQNLTIHEIYKKLQQWLEDRVLVDKSPLYTLDTDILRRAEVYFNEPKYIHLVRHPMGVIHSFEEAKLDQVFPYNKNFSVSELGELVWLLCVRNIREFIREVPKNRVHTVIFEDLVYHPTEVVSGICDFLGIQYHEEMLDVYKDTGSRMAGGIHEESRMAGDPKFLTHTKIDPGVAHRWKKKYKEDFLGEITWKLAETIGYKKKDYFSDHAPLQIDPVPNADYYELSHSQRRLWILHQFEEGLIAYNSPSGYRLKGELNRKALEKAIESFIQRHEILRTIFVRVDGEPKQMILEYDPGRFPIEFIDLRKEEDPESRAGELQAAEAKTVFNMEAGPFVKLKLLHLGEDDYLLLFTMHHIVFDGWSRGVFIRELVTLYNAYLEGKTNPLPPLRIQYKDYAAWQNKLLSGDRLRKHQEYWLERFRGDVPFLELPTDRPRPPLKTYNGDVDSFFIDAALTGGLRDISKTFGTSLFMTLVAVVKALFSRYSGQEDITIGTVVAGRDHAELEDQVGFYVGMLALRSQFDGNGSFEDLLSRVKETVLGAFEHQVYPFDRLVDELDLDRDTSRSPLFDVVVTMQDSETGNEGGALLKNLSVSPSLSRLYVSRYDLAIPFEEHENGIIGFIEYNSDLFLKSRIQQMGEHFKEIIASIVDNPLTPLFELEYISSEAKHRLLVEFNDTQVDFPVHQTVLHLFEAQVEKNPDNIAVIGIEERKVGRQQITYRELNRKANRLASLLRKRGAKTDTIVGIMADHSIELMVGVLGILKTGGAYLPIDPDTPANRITFMLEDCGASILLTNSDIIKKYSFVSLQNLQAVKFNVLFTSPRPQIKDFDSLPLPDRSLVDYEEYNKYIGQAMVKNSIVMQATRGCPFKCAYCFKIWPKSHVFRSSENIFAEVRLYYNLGVRRFIIVDDVFNLNRENSMKFFRLIVENNLDVQLFFPTGMRGDILTKEYIDLMVEAGVVNFALALETASPRLQKLIGKNLDIERLRENLEYICKKYPHVILELFTMHGFPTETQEEAMMTLEFVKSLKWVHFPYIHILKIYPNTDMAQIAVENGISRKAIAGSEDMALHELPGTLPFDMSFTLKYQADFLSSYFLSKERLLYLLPYQLKALSRDELVQKYNSYLPVNIKTFDDLLEFVGIREDELGIKENDYFDEESVTAGDLNRKIRELFPVHEPAVNALRILVLDLSQFFSTDSDDSMLYDLAEPPLGPMYIVTYLHHVFGAKVNCKIAKSRIDFNSYRQLKNLLEDFKPDVIGIRTMTFYRNFFHEAVSMIRQWGFQVPLIAGGPYATSGYASLLQDGNVDLVVMGEGEITFSEVIEKIMENNGKLPSGKELRKIPGIAFIPRDEAEENTVRERGCREIIMLDAAAEVSGMGGEPAESSESVSKPSDLAYTIFTSGSTGRPKGVIVDHLALTNFISSIYNKFERNFGPGDSGLSLTNISFDVNVCELFLPLSFGGRLTLLPKDKMYDLEILCDAIVKENVTFAYIPPALLKIINEYVKDGGSQVVFDKLLVGVEPIKDYVLEDYLKLNEGMQIINGYGPTEATICAAFFKYKSHTPDGSRVPIGQPLSNMKILLLDKNDRLVPVGIPGELCIIGHGVARGYLNRQELTAEKFVANPFFVGEKMYRTGDLAKWLPDGNILFLGRKDFQVKVRGYRIELGEVQNRLLKHKEVSDAIVMIRKETVAGTAAQYICAYFVSPRELEASELREFLSRDIPNYMIPSHFVQLEKIPLNPSGKVDRKALPQPVPETGDAGGTPGNEIERKLLELWSDVLNIDKDAIRIDSVFFELGGHSLKAINLITKIHKELQVRLPLEEIFKTPTIKELSEYILKMAPEYKFVTIEPVEEKEYYTVSSVQKRMHFLQQVNQKSIYYNITEVMPLDEDIEKEKLEAVFRELIARHENLRTSLFLLGDRLFQRIHDHIEFSIEYYDIADDAGEEEEEGKRFVEEIIRGFVRPFDLSQPPLFRVGLINTGKPGDVLVVDMHHIISDRISMDLIAGDFKTLYQGEAFPPLRLQYKDYAEWQNRKESIESLKNQENYWLKVYEKKPAALNLPLDFPRPEVQIFEGNSITFVLAEEETKSLKQTADKEDVTVFMILLAAYNILLAKLSGQHDIIVGIPVAGRWHADLEKILGLFVNVLALRNYPSDQATLAEFLKELKQNTLEAFENQEYQFENLVENVLENRDTSRSPLFDVMFNFLDYSHPSTSALNSEESGQRPGPGNGKQIYKYENRTSVIDMLLAAVDTGNTILFTISYSTRLFKEETMQRFADYYMNIISSILMGTHREIAEIEIMSEEERNNLFNKINGKNGEGFSNGIEIIHEPEESLEVEFDF